MATSAAPCLCTSVPLGMVLLLVTGAAGHAGTGCNLTPHPTVTPCPTPVATPNPGTCQGCSMSYPIQHAAAQPCRGGFDLRGSEYDTTCGTAA